MQREGRDAAGGAADDALAFDAVSLDLARHARPGSSGPSAPRATLSASRVSQALRFQRSS